MNSYNVWKIIFAIRDNEKIMEKLRLLNVFEQRKKIDGYIVAKCREMKIKLNEEERRECWYEIYRKLQEVE